MFAVIRCPICSITAVTAASSSALTPSECQAQLQVDLAIVSARRAERTKSRQAEILPEVRRAQVALRRRVVGMIQRIARVNAQRQIVLAAGHRAKRSRRRTGRKYNLTLSIN